MYFKLFLINFLLILGSTHARRPTSRHGGVTLLSQLMPGWHIRRHTSLGLKPPTCAVSIIHGYNKSPKITVYGITRNFTAVLTGYGPGQDGSRPRQNRGFLYGWNSKVRPSMNGKSSFLFYSDLVLPKLPKGRSQEFCAHIFSPPLKIGESVSRALGTTFLSPNRDFGSDERLVDTVLRESDTNSRKISTCCFLLSG